MEHKLMTEQEKVEVSRKRVELEAAGKYEESVALAKTVPAPAYLAKVFKEKFGAEFLINGGYNLAEAEAAYGKDWLTR